MNKVKYERRKRKERVNSTEREARLREFERGHQERVTEHKQREELRRLLDPKRSLYQELVNVLYTYLNNDPIYKLNEVCKIFGGFEITEIGDYYG